MRRERRTAYVGFVHELLEVHDTFERIEFGNLDKIHEDLSAALLLKSKYERAVTVLTLFASPKVTTAVIQGKCDLHRLLDSLRTATKRIMEEYSDSVSASEVSKQIMASTMDAKLALLRSLEATINAMREEEFERVGRITLQNRSGLESRSP